MVPSRLQGLKTALLAFLFLWFGGLIFWLNGPFSVFQKYHVPHLPFGFFASPQSGGVFTQDFSYNLVYFRGIEAHTVPRPYRLEDQEKLVRKALPRFNSGISHAYSPVAFILARPLLRFSGKQAYCFYCAFCTAGILFLFHGWLLPRAGDPLQVGALALCAVSVCVELAFFQGQSVLLTTTLLGFFWVLLRRERPSPAADFGLAVLFWTLCLKPSVAIIPFALLLGARAWRPLALGCFLLLLSWLWVAPFYGGWWTGLRDYSQLLNHYNNADFTPFMRRDYTVGHDAEIRLLFAFDRAATGLLILALLLLRWGGRLTLSGLFQSLIGVFLLFSPYLLPSEDWILCLLVVEGAFFRYTSLPAALGKLFVLLGILDLRVETILPWQINFEMRCLLFVWMAAEALMAERRKAQLVPA